MSGFVETEEQQALRRAVAAMAANYGQDYYLEKARAGQHTTELWNEAGKLGFIGVNLPEEYGGGGAGMYELSLVMEEMAATGCALLMMVVSPAINGTIISKFGTEEQKRRWLPGIADGSITMAFAITEPDAGSNSHRITTTARRDGSDWILKGQKVFISGIDQAQAVLVVGRTEDHKTGNLKPALFVIPTDTPGLHWTKIEMELISPESQFQVFLDDVRVPPMRWWVPRTPRSRNCSPASIPSASWVRPVRWAWAGSRSTRPSITSRPARSGRCRSARTRVCHIRWRRTTSRSNSPS